MRHLYELFVKKLQLLADLPPLFFRLTLFYGFLDPALKKAKNIDGIINWFGEGGLGLPFPEVNAYLATATECAGVVAMLLGLGTRLMSIPMMVVMVVAVATVHWKNGFPCGQEGYEIPFYYFLMLFSLLITGPGRISVDALIRRKVTSDA